MVFFQFSTGLLDSNMACVQFLLYHSVKGIVLHTAQSPGKNGLKSADAFYTHTLLFRNWRVQKSSLMGTRTDDRLLFSHSTTSIEVIEFRFMHVVQKSVDDGEIRTHAPKD